MKVTVQKPVTIEVKYVEVVLPVKYDEEDIPMDTPGRIGDWWRAIIDIDTGQVTSVAKGSGLKNHALVDWPVGTPLDLYMKVTDGGTYRLLNAAGQVEAEIVQDYVPNSVIPGDYGDYVELNINENGLVTNWNPDPELEAFFGANE